MEISRHCTFCDHKKFDFTTGNFCGLTDQKAAFIRKCPKIKFDLNANEEIAKINLDYKSIKDEKGSVIQHLILYAILGVAIIFAGIYFANNVFGSGWTSDIISKKLYWLVAGFLIIISSGMYVVGHAFKPYIRYINAYSVVKLQKKEMDSLFALYDYAYKIDFKQEDEYDYIYEYAEVKLFRSKPKIR